MNLHNISSIASPDRVFKYSMDKCFRPIFKNFLIIWNI